LNAPSPNDFQRQPRAFRHYLLLTGITLAFLVPFSGKPFHMDDPLFVWAAENIVHHPLNPYGFDVVWYTTAAPMWWVAKNPPLASYYGALITLLAGLSERAWHIAFALPALGVVLGTHRLAERFTAQPLLAALTVLVAPGFLVSATGVMCDTLMVALWLWAAIFWIDGLDSNSSARLLLAALLAALCALTKYFGMSLIVLLFVYSLLRARGVNRAASYLLVPLFVLAGYQLWTHHLYGHGLLSDAMAYAVPHQDASTSFTGKTLEGCAFAGGCALAPLIILPLLWSRKIILVASGAGAVVGTAVGLRVVKIGAPLAVDWDIISLQFAVLVIGGFSLLALVVHDAWKRRDSDSYFLALWVLGTFVFAVFLNWTLNARSVLPLIPAAGIVLARRLDDRTKQAGRKLFLWLLLAITGCMAIWITAGDLRLAEVTRQAVENVLDNNRGQSENLYFQGHWGFQYYMQKMGAHPFDLRHYQPHANDVIVIPENNTNQFDLRPDLIASQNILEEDMDSRISTMSQPMGAGFYTALWGPLPFAIGTVPAERYQTLTLRAPR
jgi:Dolichyl-phosphate-mannose-protein mannosyltransferase